MISAFLPILSLHYQNPCSNVFPASNHEDHRSRITLKQWNMTGGYDYGLYETQCEHAMPTGSHP